MSLGKKRRNNIEESIGEMPEIFSPTELLKEADIPRYEGSKEMKEMATEEEYDFQRISESPPYYSKIGDLEVSDGLLTRGLEAFQKSIQIIWELEEVEEGELRDIAREYIECDSLSAKTFLEGEMVETLREHPQIDYKIESGKYRRKG